MGHYRLPEVSSFPSSAPLCPLSVVSDIPKTKIDVLSDLITSKFTYNLVSLVSATGVHTRLGDNEAFMRTVNENV